LDKALKILCGVVVQTQEEELPVTPRKESAKGDATPSTFTVSQRWFAEHRKQALLLAIAIVSPLISLWYANKIVGQVKQEMWVWNVDSSGVITYAPIGLVDANSAVFREVVLQAMEVYLKRNPGGLSNPEMLQRYFSASAAKAVKMEVIKTDTERTRRNLFDQAEFTKLPERLDASSGTYRYRVVGYIVRNGVLDGMPERDIGDFKIGLELEANDSVRDKGRFPFTVRQYRCMITWRSNGTTEDFSSATGVKTVTPAGGAAPQ
jgi:hypothetical protein